VNAENGRVQDKVVALFGGGQTPGATVGNGRAAALLYAREGARVMVGDLDLASAEETASMIRAQGGAATAFEVDVRSEKAIEGMVSATTSEYGRIDVVHYNVGVSQGGGDAPVDDISAEAFTRVTEINLRGMVLAAKHAIPAMRRQGGGAMVNIGSIAARMNYPWVSYKTSKAGVIALTEHLALVNAEHGIRVNCVLPGLMDTPMAVEHRLRDGASREEIVAQRSDRVPLKSHRGDAWDVARASLFLASDEASFITGVALTVDGGQTLLVG
jgi:NAD(P)-dependent dehydrogenase (short-subunit alcohol dehydrogenase family)